MHEGLQCAVMNTAHWQVPDERIHRGQRTRIPFEAALALVLFRNFMLVLDNEKLCAMLRKKESDADPSDFLFELADDFC